MKASTILTAAVAATTAMTLAALPASAKYVGKKFENRIDRQFSRIQQGVRSGELTRYEAVSLRMQNRRIAKRLNKFRRDGRLDRFERQRLNRMLSNASDRIYAEKHDNDRRWGRGWGKFKKKYSQNRWY